MGILEAIPFAFRDILFTFVLVGYYGGAAVDRVSKVYLVIKDPCNRPIVPAVNIFRVGGSTILTTGLVSVCRGLEYLLLPKDILRLQRLSTERQRHLV